MDMRGFGRCKTEAKFSTADQDREKISHEKSYEDIVALVQQVKQTYPDIRLIAMGESLGCTFCVKLAAEHPELVNGVILSAPAVHINSDMYAGKGQIRQGVKAVFKPQHEVDMSSFFTDPRILHEGEEKLR
jgi:alpha-beta hydrolase superfamily lysophospholipase